MRSCALNGSRGALGHVQEADLVFEGVDQGGTLAVEGSDLAQVGFVIVHFDQASEAELTVKDCKAIVRVENDEVLVAFELVALKLDEASLLACHCLLEVVMKVYLSVRLFWLCWIVWLYLVFGGF